MRAHQAASTASSSREKWMRPLVVGPSPVMTPSRTMVRAWAAVLRQEIFEGSRAPTASAALGVEADIGYTSHFLVLVQQSTPGVNEWLTIRNFGRENFKWLPIRRSDIRYRSEG